MKKRRWMIVCCLFVLLLVLSGCGGQEQPGIIDEEPDEARLEIGITFDSFVIERWQRDRDVFVAAAQELGADVNVQNANGSIEEQIRQIEYFIKKKVDAIVVVQVADDSGSLKDVVADAHRAGIPVIAYDRQIMNAGADLYISFDNEAVGRLMGEHMREHLGGEGRILQICGPMADNNVPQVMTGFSKAIAGSELSITLTEYAQGWHAETGFSVTSSYLGAMPEPDGIMCGNDSIAGQAIRALSEHRLAGGICVVGQDADLDACQRIVEGTQCMTVYKPVEKLARRAAELAVQLAVGEKPEVARMISDGSDLIPFECLEPVAVTKENMDEIITGKYHEASDIYLNVK
ncbi:MAG: substrate-binding domain-containing protein [bacterium]|nr:substrate-binding domain-containing protein [bacterium]MDY4100172.1 substrate-binding domain-containing protein [Lachnospiraceae bacterium]